MYAHVPWRGQCKLQRFVICFSLQLTVLQQWQCNRPAVLTESLGWQATLSRLPTHLPLTDHLQCQCLRTVPLGLRHGTGLSTKRGSSTPSVASRTLLASRVLARTRSVILFISMYLTVWFLYVLVADVLHAEAILIPALPLATTVGKVDLNLKGEILTLYANTASHGDWQHRCRTHPRSSRMFGCSSSRGREIGEDQTRKVASAASPPR